MPYPWFRMWNSFLADDKVQMLEPVMFKHWVNLLAVANQGNPRGSLPSSDRIAFHLRVTKAEAEVILQQFLGDGLLDAMPDGSLMPHNWPRWQPAGDGQSTERSRSWRAGQKRNGPATSHATDMQRCSDVARNASATLPPNSVLSSLPTEKGSLSEKEDTDLQRCTDVARNGSATLQDKACPEYPDPETSFVIVHPGPHEIPGDQARSIWRRLWATWGDEKILHGWYEHQRWYSMETWLAAFAETKKQYGSKAVGIRLIEKIAAGIDAHGVQEAKPFAPEDRGASATTNGRPKTAKQQWREEVSEHLRKLKEKNRAAEAAEAAGESEESA